MKINKISSLFAATATLSTLLTALPAKAIIYDWQFTNEDGDFGNPTDIVKGFVEFNDADVFAGATNVKAINFQINSVTELNETSAPFFGDGGIEINSNLLNLELGEYINSFYFDAEEEIILNGNNSSYRAFGRDNESGWEEFAFSPSVIYFLQQNQTSFRDNDSSSLQFTRQSASVPFEFSPTTEFFLVSGIFGFKRYFKHRQANKLVNK